MKNFALESPRDVRTATSAAARPGASFIAGGTTLIDLWKLGAYPVSSLVDIQALPLRGVHAGPDGLRAGALERMNAVGQHPGVVEHYPVVSQSLLLAASPQIRNMATLGGNLLQRPRSVTYRNPDPTRQDGPSRFDAIFGITAHSRAPHPSDLAVALTALDAKVRIQDPDGRSRRMALSSLYQLPQAGLKFDTLAPGELIVSLEAQVPFARRSAYIKIRDRASFQFAVVSAAAVLDLEGGRVREARLAAGGVGTIPWRFPEVEARLRGSPATDDAFDAALADIGAGAETHARNRFKVELLRRTALRALREARDIS